MLSHRLHEDWQDHNHQSRDTLLANLPKHLHECKLCELCPVKTGKRRLGCDNDFDLIPSLTFDHVWSDIF